MSRKVVALSILFRQMFGTTNNGSIKLPQCEFVNPPLRKFVKFGFEILKYFCALIVNISYFWEALIGFYNKVNENKKGVNQEFYKIGWNL